MHDLVIRNALLLDGLGSASKRGDLAVAGGKISATGRDLGAARETLDADGLALMPGIIDNHTHYGARVADPRGMRELDGLYGQVLRDFAA